MVLWSFCILIFLNKPNKIDLQKNMLYVFFRRGYPEDDQGTWRSDGKIITAEYFYATNVQEGERGVGVLELRIASKKFY